MGLLLVSTTQNLIASKHSVRSAHGFIKSNSSRGAPNRDITSGLSHVQEAPVPVEIAWANPERLDPKVET